MTPIPADTFRQSTPQISQNCGVFQALLRCTFLAVIMALPALLAGGAQPCGFQPDGGTRYASAPAIMNTK